MDNTRKCPGRPSLKRPPTNCSGIPIPTEEIERRKCTRTGRAKRKRRVTSLSPDFSSGGGGCGACRLPQATEAKIHAETKSSASKQEIRPNSEMVQIEPNQDVCHHDFCYSDNGRKNYRSIDGTPVDEMQFSESLNAFKVTTSDSNSFDRAFCQTKDSSSVAIYASKSLLPTSRTVKQTKLTFSIDSILGRTVCDNFS